MGCLGSKLNSYLTISQLNSLLEELKTTPPAVTVTVVASHIHKEDIEEDVSKKVSKGMHIKNKGTGMVLAVDSQGNVVFEEEGIALGQCWEWDGIGHRKYLRNKAYKGVLEVVDGTNLAMRERDPFSRMQEFLMEKNFLSCDMFSENVLDASSDGRPIYWKKHGGINQQWEMGNYSHWDTFFIQNRATKNILGVFQDSGSGTKQLRMTSSKHKDGQIWAWWGQNQIKNQTSGLVLDFLGDGQVRVYESLGRKNQQWTLDKLGQVKCQEGGQVLDLDNWGQVILSPANAGMNQKWDLIPVTRTKVVETKIETFKHEEALELVGSNDLSPKFEIPEPSANIPIVKVTASLEVRPHNSTSAQSLNQFQQNLRKRFHMKDDTVETFVVFSISSSSLEMEFEANQEKVIKAYDPRFEEEAKGGIFRSPKEASVRLHLVKTFIARPVTLESAATSGYPSVQHVMYNTAFRSAPASGGYPPASGTCPSTAGGYPPATGGYPPITRGYPAAIGGHLPIAGSLPPATGGYPPAYGFSGGHPPASECNPLASGGSPRASGLHPPARGGYPPASVSHPSGNIQDFSGPVAPLPPGWTEEISQTGRRFFLNRATKKAQWEIPQS